jgi:Flp pilus assembly protein TadB
VIPNRPQTILIGVVAGAGLGALWWPLVPLVAAVVAASRVVVPRRRAGRRRAAVADSLPEVVDVVMVALSAGSTIVGALQLAAIRGPTPARPGLASTLERHHAGEPLAVALRSVADLVHPEFRALALTLAQAERDGAPLAAVLQRLADEAQRARRRRLEAAARRIPVQMLPPLVLCALPAVVVGAVVPLVVVSLRRL